MPSVNKPLYWVSLFAGAAMGLASAVPADDTFGPMTVPAAAESFKVGSVQVTALHDAQYVVKNDGKAFGVDAGPAAVGELLKANNLPTDRVTLSLNVLLVRTGNRVLLLDSGLGADAHAALIASLAEAGVSPEEVTDVLITHSHGDHVGGLSEGGKRTFSKAVIRMSTTEWSWMKQQSDSADLVKIIDGHVQTFTPGTTIVPGVTSLALDGHTPGHVGYELTFNGQQLLDIGDLAHSSIISLKKPGWTTQFDSDAAAAKASRATTFARLAKTHELVFAPHFPYPGVGHIVADGAAYKWVPETR
jgi:glyoxylase-like metal-dependent hydrolase (beta-lactamase superfamily II)